jgi:hypothetical protein
LAKTKKHVSSGLHPCRIHNTYNIRGVTFISM